MLSPKFRRADAIQGHTGVSGASAYRHFDLEKLAMGVAAIRVPGDWKSQWRPDVGAAFGGGLCRIKMLSASTATIYARAKQSQGIISHALTKSKY